MASFGDLRALPGEAQRKLQELLHRDWEAQARGKVDETTRAVTGGLSVEELRAIFRGDPPTEKPNPRYKLFTKSFLFHIRPRYYQRGSTWFTHTFRLGWLSAFTFFIEVITGVILMIFYAPTPGRAYGDMLNILSNVPFGRFMRDLHRLGAEMMVIAVALHMLRVYLTGAYKHPRQFTWLTGVVLLLSTLLLSFSGYLLPWDQLAYWAVTIGTSMADKAPVGGREANLLLRGAPDIGAGGLLRFYLLHVLFVPLLAILFISIHYYKVSREHSISLPAVIDEGEMDEDKRKFAKERVDLIPDLMTHELFLTVLVTAVMILSVVTWFHAPLEHHADPFVTPLDTEAPWYFLWIQGMLKLGDPTIMGVILPTLIFALLFAVPYIDRNPSRLGKNRKVAIAMGILSVMALVILSYMGTPHWGIVTPPAPRILQDIAPQEGLGPLRELGYEGVQVGTFETDSWTLPPSPTEFDRLFAQFQARVREAGEQTPGVANMKGDWNVEQWQPTMRRVLMTIRWNKVENGQIVTGADGNPVVDQYSKAVYLHKDASRGE
ncbi:MAG: cytochrome bc complex cytochrome b subunit [Ardenticatenaceae bacterium]|nr:cytochrome bc complex cytochrome b subunit [Ardenticatenaceae bacterium]